jgi:large subunit ribosomal protein L21
VLSEDEAPRRLRGEVMTGENKMRFAIVESGGKQYRAIEGSTIDVDRLAHEVGKSFDFERVMLMGDGDDFMIGTPLVSGIIVSATVASHIKGPKVISFKYRPKKRIRVKGGHRHQYTRLMIDFIGKPGEERKKAEKPVVEKKAKAEAAVVEAAPKAEKPAKAKKEAAPKAAPKKTEKASEKKPAAKKSTKK